jgi:hypothetical protein
MVSRIGIEKTGVLFLAGERDSTLLQRVQKGYGGHPAPSPMGPGDKWDKV